MENSVVERATSQYLVQMVAVGIRNEYLTETVAGHQAHNLLHPLGVKLIEDIVEQQEGCRL
jgi:hypothetical protein